MNSDAAMVCRCEDVSLEEVRRLIDEGFDTMDEIKRLTRCGMGPCQGKTCRLLVLLEIARRKRVAPGDVKVSTFRPPTKPVSLAMLVEAEERRRAMEHEGR